MSFDLKPGDKIWVCDDMVVGVKYNGIVFKEEMKEFKGKLLTFESSGLVSVKAKESEHFFSHYMVLPAIRNSFCDGDVVRLRPDIQRGQYFDGMEITAEIAALIGKELHVIKAIDANTNIGEQDTHYLIEEFVAAIPARILKPVSEGEPYYKIPQDGVTWVKHVGDLKKESKQSNKICSAIKNVIGKQYSWMNDLLDGNAKQNGVQIFGGKKEVGKPTSTENFQVQHHKEIILGLNELYRKKNADYGDSFHLSYLEEGMAMPRIRLSDKLNRFKALTKSGKQEVKDESIRDTLLDLANYAILTVMELDRKKEETA